MKTILVYFKAFVSLIPLGFLFFLMASAMLLAVASQFSDPFNGALERMKVLNRLEGEISAQLGEMQLQEASLAFAREYELPEKDYQNRASQAREHIRTQITELQESYDPELEYASDIRELLQAFVEILDEHEQIFDDTMQAIAEKDAENAYIAMLELEDHNQVLTAALREIIIVVEQDRQTALADFPKDTNQGVLYTSVAMAVCLLLSMVGYSLISLAVRPLRHLGNMMNAIAGDHYRRQSHQREIEQGGLAGALARKLDQLAQDEQTRSAGSKQEIERLRLELYESRKQRLKLYHDDEKVK